jgi:hypothetical protein
MHLFIACGNDIDCEEGRVFGDELAYHPDVDVE